VWPTDGRECNEGAAEQMDVEKQPVARGTSTAFTGAQLNGSVCGVVRQGIPIGHKFGFQTMHSNVRSKQSTDVAHTGMQPQPQSSQVVPYLPEHEQSTFPPRRKRDIL
jgi:hypothetical protein